MRERNVIEFNQRRARKMLGLCNGDRTLAARLLGVSDNVLRDLLANWRPKYRTERVQLSSANVAAMLAANDPMPREIDWSQCPLAQTYGSP